MSTEKNEVKEIEENTEKVVRKGFLTAGRFFYRTGYLAIISVCSFVVLYLLSYLGKEHLSDINSQFPEIMVIVNALAIMTWAELSVFWIRLVVQPDLDVQKIGSGAQNDPMASAFVYFTNTLAWALRIIIFFKLTGLMADKGLL